MTMTNSNNLKRKNLIINKLKKELRKHIPKPDNIGTKAAYRLNVKIDREKGKGKSKKLRKFKKLRK